MAINRYDMNRCHIHRVMQRSIRLSAVEYRYAQLFRTPKKGSCHCPMPRQQLHYKYLSRIEVKQGTIGIIRLCNTFPSNIRSRGAQKVMNMCRVSIMDDGMVWKRAGMCSMRRFESGAGQGYLRLYDLLSVIHSSTVSKQKSHIAVLP